MNVKDPETANLIKYSRIREYLPENNSERSCINTYISSNQNQALTMKIAIIGTGNVGAALATKWANCGHTLYLGTRNIHKLSGTSLLNNPGTSAKPYIVVLPLKMV